METKLPRAFVIELVGAFGLVLFSAGLTCINQMTAPAGISATTALTGHQPGVVGVALGQGLILAAMLALTVPATGGYLNPAATLMLWVFGKTETPRALAMMGAQFLGGLLAALTLRLVFEHDLLQAAQFGAPHVNALAYHPITQPTLFTGMLIELLLTFFLVFAIFSLAGSDALRLGMVAGMIATVCILFGFPLTGAALNPARWFGPTLVEAFSSTLATRNPWADTLVYLAGPILGALAGGVFVFKVMPTEKK
ncbi:MAG TPA: aquaporin [Gemmataceae bacterium]|nr:aquaporin [Gemmataceae bacterium]